MLENLLSVIRSDAFDEHAGSFCFESAVWHDEIIDLKINVHSGYGFSNLWMIKCSDVRASRFLDRTASSLILSDSHPLLWPHVEPTMQLFFCGIPSAPPLVIVQLLAAHERLVSHWFPFGNFLNAHFGGGWKALERLLAKGYGMLAEGPETLINAYRKVLVDNGLRPSNPPPHSSKHWNGTCWIENFSSYQVLVLDNSFVVASHFEATEIT